MSSIPSAILAQSGLSRLPAQLLGLVLADSYVLEVPAGSHAPHSETRTVAVVLDGLVRMWRTAVLELGEGYAFAAQVMVRAAERIAQLPAGAFTPASAFGPDFVLELDGVVRRDVGVETTHTNGPLGLLARFATVRAMWALFALEVLVLGGENLLTFPLSVPFMRAATGQVYLDFCAFCSSAEVAAQVSAFGSTGRALQLWLLPTIDVLIPVLSCLTGLVAIKYYTKGLEPAHHRLLLVPLLAILLDFAENAAIAALLLASPEPSARLAMLVGLLSGLKFVAYAALCLAVLWLLALRRRGTRRANVGYQVSKP